MRILVCGGAGFIGSAFVHQRVAAGDDVRVLDALTYAGREENLDGLDVDLVIGRIEDPGAVEQAAADVEAIVNFAAETHVDRSILDAQAFVTTNAVGTFTLLEEARRRGVRYVQVSTDEVYGSIDDGAFTEQHPLEPSSPYSASKAGADLMVLAAHHTYGQDVVIARGSNCYGPRQFPEKLIPIMVLNAIHGGPLPVYGDGQQVRTWLHVDDFASGIHAVLEHGAAGQAYNVGGAKEKVNLDVVSRIVDLTDASPSQVKHVEDRLGHDRRYALDSSKLRQLAGWAPRVDFDEGGLESTVHWYRDHEWWWRPLVETAEYRAYYRRVYDRDPDF
ncbi:dTDP-glucose 46-dehydratase [Patulibacter medicamentivorans]|uniref:dTDP-glucose 4,6-dehydratase n=1 Tax=Patulibacter medicamentivorans TaxID=1097667 RepID=H0EAB8_9ACTN|nr:dTDP-glucose 4,6-dehydratase [Patulibacter medicamentivorans]EHN09372.1 dTDP-glucose 46-dehydratase [Patulibacter medicamentivorans]